MKNPLPPSGLNFVSMMFRVVCFGFLLSFVAFGVAAQQTHYVQMSGMVLSFDTSRSPIPYATVFNRSLGIGGYTNMDGFYTLVVRAGDSIVVQSLGYGGASIVVPQIDDDIWLYTILLEPRAYLLQETVVYPWGTRDQFRQAFVYMNIPDDDLERARKNLDPNEMQRMASMLAQDGQATTQTVLRNYQNSYYYKGQIPQYNIFSPLAWAQFFSDLKQGKYKDPNKP